MKSYLVSLEAFAKDRRNLSLDELQPFYDREFIQWRHSSARLKRRSDAPGAETKPLANRTINSEIVTHKQFYSWCIQRGYATKRLECEELLLDKANKPFPKKHYAKLLSVARDDIQHARTNRNRWSKLNYYTAILLMNRIGCRVVEIKNLEWSHITKSRAGTELYLYGKKEKGRIKERNILVPDAVAEYLERLRDDKRRTGKPWGWNEAEFPFVFTGWQQKTRQTHFDTEQRRKWMRLAGLPNPDDWPYVCFRHKFITDALNQGVHSLPLAKYTGTSARMIETTYSGYVSKEVFAQVFADAPTEALERKAVLPNFLNSEDDE
jgi:integrase